MRRYRFAGVDILIRVEEPTVCHAVEEVFQYVGSRNAPDALGSAAPTLQPVEMDLSVGSVGLSVPESARRMGTLGVRAEVWEAGPAVFLSGGGSVFELDPAAGRGRGRIHPRWLDEANALNWHLLEFVMVSLLVLFRHRRLYPLHAAALHQDGRGLLLVADSDSGKSTLAFSLVREGWQYLSDDAILLDATGPAIEAVAFRKKFGLDFEAAAFFPELDGDATRQFSEEQKWAVSMEALFPAQASERCVPHVLVFPKIVDEPESRLVEIRGVDALYEVVRQSALLRVQSSAGVATHHVEALRHLVMQTRHHRLRCGRDIVEQPRRASELLAPLLASTPVQAGAGNGAAGLA